MAKLGNEIEFLFVKERVLITANELIEILKYSSNEYGSDINIYIDIKEEVSGSFNNCLLGVKMAEDGSIVLTNYV